MGWNLSGERYDEIRETVADLIEDWGISRYPFSIWELLRTMGIRVIPYSTLPQQLRVDVESCWPDAVSVFPPDFNPVKTVIFYNDSRDRFRIRFTLAHELAHLVLGHPDTGEIKYEDEANFFANYFLAPVPLVLEHSQINYEVIQIDFAVSFSAARSVCDRAQKRRQYGPRRYVEYERRILESCHLEEGVIELPVIAEDSR